MIAIDTSALVAFFHDEGGNEVGGVELAFESHCAVFPSPVLTEILSDHKLSPAVIELLQQIPLLEVKPGYWERAGLLRSRILKRGYKARIADSLIAQACIDHAVPLVTKDGDYRHFSKYAGLQIFRS